jgi:lipoprotein-releasing system permease protein
VSRQLVFSLAWRYVRGRNDGGLHGTARAALVSTSLGVSVMVVAMALMTGYSEDLQRKLVGGSAAVVAYPLGGAVVADSQRDAIEDMAGVVSVAEVAYGQGSLSRLEHPSGHDVVLRGVDPDTPLEIAAGVDLSYGGAVPPVLLGSELARQLGVQVGESLQLVGVDLEDLRFRYRRVRFVGTFETGFAEADARWMIVDRRLIDEIGGDSRLVEIALEEPMAVERLSPAIEATLGDEFLVTDWRQYNRELFTALRLQKIALFLVLGLIVVVGTFNVASTLVVLNRERRREVGVLTAMGLRPRAVEGVFLMCGVWLGAAGSLLGAVLGAGVSWALTTFEIVRFDPGVAAIYFIDSVPFRVEPLDVLAVLGFALGATLLASWLPARRAAAMDVTEALRYD